MADINYSKDIIPHTESINWQIDTSIEWWTDWLNDILLFVKDSIFELLAVLSIWIFIYIGYMFIKADWNPEEMKKAFMSLINVVIGLFIVSISWALVKMVSWITF
jgi:hypothetical protein